MNRNRNTKFSHAPIDIDIQRSRFSIPNSHKTTMNASYLYPIYMQEVLPGDTFDMTMSTLVRMSTPIFPVMDDCVMDTFFFFCPNRLLWDNFKQFMGENNVSAWTSDIEYNIPQISPPNVSGWTYGGVADHFGLPPARGRMSVSALPFRAYRLIYNEWFRDQNLQDPLLVNTGDTETDNTYDKLLKVCKMHDLFTSCLPAPQKAPDVLIPVEWDAAVPVYPNDVRRNNPLTLTGGDVDMTYPVKTYFESDHVYMLGTRPPTPNVVAYPIGDEVGDLDYKAYIPSNLVASYTGLNAGVGTINQLRTAFQIQKLYERDARSGSRYTEVLKSHFKVSSPDQSLQRPQYLGGERIPISINQVVQTSATDDVSPQGNTAAFSKTVSRKNLFNNSFTEHGIIIGVACIRTLHTYQQGIERYWNKKTRLDFYTPELANIGEQPVLNQEIYYSQADPVTPDPENTEVFGYQEAWFDYRYKPSIITGAFRHDSDQGSLDAWTYADYFAERPYLSAEFIEETTANVDRTLAVDSDRADQFLVDMHFNLISDRPLPVNSIPGLADHH